MVDGGWRMTEGGKGGEGTGQDGGLACRELRKGMTDLVDFE
jgi:hypothetical protein